MTNVQACYRDLQLHPYLQNEISNIQTFAGASIPGLINFTADDIEPFDL